jgi:hypothetical protein
MATLRILARVDPGYTAVGSKSQPESSPSLAYGAVLEWP